MNVADTDSMMAPDGSAFLYVELDRDENVTHYYRASIDSGESTLLMTSTNNYAVIEWIPPLSE